MNRTTTQTGEAASAHEAATLELRSVTKRYPGADEDAIAELSLEVPAGDICVLVGPSGCGKTTAMRLVNRMISITSGDILLAGRSVTELRPAELRKRIGYVIQQIGLFPHRTIAQNIATVPRLLDWKKERTAARVRELLDLVSLPAEMADRYPAQLSGGQRQRVGVARALAADPPLMLMDEPFGAIDPITRERLQNEFLRLQSELRKTIVFVTHDIDEAIKMGDRIAVLRKGGVLAQYATPAELLMAPADDFVEDFVGADRALKRLALLRVRDVQLWRAPLVREGDSTAQAREQVRTSDLPYPLLVSEDGRPLGWLSEDDLVKGRVELPVDTAAEPVLDRDSVLRDALAELLERDTQYGPVVDQRGHVVGVLSLELISHFLASSDAIQADPADRVTDTPALS
ncbi:MAG: ABC transporter ATP-binding protein [Solirubrobacteraceae bacterium]|nr:MAG: ABC transporter ATP-binding protein [Solirubrobacterales bacterium]